MLVATALAAMAQMSPESYKVAHSDSCWYFTLDYDTPKMPKDEGLLVVTHICTPDTCISSAARHLQGKRYAKRYVKRYGTHPELHKQGSHRCTLTMPERCINDTVYAVTYCEYDNGEMTEFLCDTVAICMPQCPPLSCHRVAPMTSYADHLSTEHPHVRSIRHYTPLTTENGGDMSITPSVVRYTTNSSKLDPEYLKNAHSIDELMGIIDEVLADSTTTLEAIQIVGYTSPDTRKRARLGEERAVAMRDHIRRHHQLPDSIFETVNGGTNWRLVYAAIRDIDASSSDSLIAALKHEPDHTKREAILKAYEGGRLYRQLGEEAFPQQHMACCTGVYYRNDHDSVATALNGIVDELINNPNPDYGRLLSELKQYRNDPRVLNLEGVIEYRRHHRHAAEQAFAKAASMGDEQAAVNLQIAENNRNKE